MQACLSRAPAGYWPSNKGFTLLEMMLTVGLIALTATFVGISISSSDSRTAGLEAQRFVALVNLAQDESILTGRPILLQVAAEQRSYSFSMMPLDSFNFAHQAVDADAVVDNDSPPQLADEFLKTRVIPDTVTLAFERMDDVLKPTTSPSMQIERVHEILNQSMFDTEDDKTDDPLGREEVLIEPNGLISPFSLTLTQDEQTYTIELDRFGRAGITKP